MKEIKILMILVLFLVPLISADVISINSGGTGNVIINPGEFVEGFFFSGEAGPVCGNGVIETGEQCDDGNVVSGDGCSSTCQTEEEEEEGGGGGGGGGGTTTPSLNIIVEPSSINLNMVVDTAITETITVQNLESTAQTFDISSSNLDNLVILDTDTMTLNPTETKTFTARFVAPGDPGIYAGSIIVDGKSIPVALNVKTSLLLFDSNIVVLNDDYQVEEGKELNTRVTLIPMGDPARLDVTLNYEIKDYNNKIYLTKSETLLVEERVEFDRDFDTGALPLGKYIIGLELIYPNGVAPSSAHFEVVERGPVDVLGVVILWLIILILLIAIIIIIILIIRYIRRKQEEQEQ